MKKKILVLCLSALAAFLPARAQTSQAVEAVRTLIERVAPGYGRQFHLSLIPAAGRDTFQIAGTAGAIELRGNNAVALSVAFDQYLKYTAKVDISWCGDQMRLPATLPAPVPRAGAINGRWRVYMNYCTLSYSMPYWNWERWQREIDLMAMRGINMPLMMIGLEGTWYNTLLKYGFTDLEARSFLTGPAHQAWQWMQNLSDYGGPLPKAWIDEHVEMGQKMMARMLELGMTPIQQGFSGYVPALLAKKFPDAVIRKQPSWNEFEGSSQLDPTDPLFLKFGHDFLVEQQKLFGAHGFYAADPFHESNPPVETKEYLNQVGRNIWRVVKDFDPNGIWVMQGWSMRSDIVRAVPQVDLLILDLNSANAQKKNACWGYDVVSGVIHNFGGRNYMHGNMVNLARNHYVRNKAQSGNVIGQGLFMEGIDQSPAYYELAAELPLYDGDVDLKQWINDYAERRYGGRSTEAQEAWQQLLRGPYSQGDNGSHSSMIAARPNLDVKKSGPHEFMTIHYDQSTLWEAARHLLACPDSFDLSGGYRFDVVDVMRQALSDLSQQLYYKSMAAYKAHNKKEMMQWADRFYRLMDDVDDLVSTQPVYSFDKWVADARSWGRTPQEKAQYERDGVALLTIWGPDKNSVLFDYAWREWGGLIKSYYKPRWQFFYNALCDSIHAGRWPEQPQNLPLSYGRITFESTPLQHALGVWELNYVNSAHKVRPVSRANVRRLARKAYARWRPVADELVLGKQGKIDRKEVEGAAGSREQTF